ncbi:type VII secretion protein [Streptomyces sp. NPDC050095]|uniref:nucleotide-binding protein n=1 Tax=unclassified Streptomyces TaxID=2593676 RepID=UPI00342F57E2
MANSGRWQDDVLRELSGAAPQAESGETREPLPVRRPDEERRHPGQPHAPAPAPAEGVPPVPRIPTAASNEPAPSRPAGSSPAVRPSRQGRLPVAAPESVPTLDPRLALALGTPAHGDSAARRTGRALRKLASSAAHEVTEETRLARLVQQPVTTGRVIAVTSIRGGVGKTTTAALLARTLNHYRHDPVLALEADSALGTLPVRLGAESVRWACADLAQILTPSMQLTDVTGYLVPIADGGWLLPASQGRLSAPLDIPTYRTVSLALRRYFAVTVVDCESLPGEVARTAMDTAHARVVVAPQTAEGVNGTRIVLDWLAQLPHAALASTVVALTTNSNDPLLELKAAMAILRETGVTVVHLPYDRQLAGGGPIRTDRLGETTRRAATELAAEAMGRAVRVR